MNHFLKRIIVFIIFYSLSFSYSIAQTTELNLDSLEKIIEKMEWKELDSIGKVSNKNRNYIEAEIYSKKAIEVAEKEYGKNDTLYALSCSRLAFSYFYQTRYKETIPFFSKEKDIWETTYGKNSISYARTCMNLGTVYSILGENENALPLLLESKETFAKSVGTSSKEYHNVCNSLGTFYLNREKYSKAEEFYEEAKKSAQQFSEQPNLSYATALNNLATLYNQLSLYQKAEALLLEAKTITEKLVGKKSADYAYVCYNLGECYKYSKLEEKAKEYHIEAKQIRERLYGKPSYPYAASCIGLAIVNSLLEQHNESEKLFLEALNIYKEKIGEDHYYYLNTLHNLASVYLEQKEYSKAETIYLSNVKKQEKLEGKYGISYIKSLYGLSVIYREQKEYEKANRYNTKATSLIKGKISLNFPILSENEKQNYFNGISFIFNGFTNLVIEEYQKNKKVSEQLFNQNLYTKGIVFSSTQKIKNQVFNSGDTTLINQYKNWVNNREEYIKLVQQPSTLENESSIENMAFQVNELEKQISKKSNLFEKSVNQKQHTWLNVKQTLSKNEAVIEMIYLVTRDAAYNAIDTIYAALIVTQNTKEQPELIVFENGSKLEKGAMAFYQNNIEFQLEDNESYNLYWKPIDSILQKLSSKGYSKIYFSPDGIYHKLNLNVLKNPKTGNFLIDEQNIQLIASSRDLIEKKSKSIDLSKNFNSYQSYLMGYPAYDRKNNSENSNDTTKIKGDSRRSFSGLQRAAGTRGVISILEGTKVETQSINQIFDKKGISSILAMNKEASEENIKALKSPTILHIATHGFFITPLKESEINTMEDAQTRNLLKNPFLRSGLLLAGCQNPPKEGEEDGVLSAEEAMNLDLEGTELVVLSACETGLGDIENGEGVYGLQRAFQQAGAKTIVMSLWKVSDEATQLLMTEFYKNLLEGKPKRKAFKDAQLTLKKSYPEPFYWGAFVMVGE